MTTEIGYVSNLQEPIRVNRYEVFFECRQPLFKPVYGIDKQMDDLRLSCKSAEFHDGELNLQFYDFIDNKSLAALNNHFTKATIVYYGPDHTVVRKTEITLTPTPRLYFSPLDWRQVDVKNNAAIIECTFRFDRVKMFDPDNYEIYDSIV